MTDEDILAILKFSAPVVGLVSALWSTTQKITYEGADGAKRLTLQGRVMIGIILLSGLVSLLALGFESLLREEQGQKAAARQERVDQADRDREARRQGEAATTRAEIAAKAQAEALADLGRDAEQQKRFLEQRFLMAAAAAEQQRRDAQISMQIAREANQRLGEAQQALAEFERINYPLREIGAQIELELDFAGLGPDWPIEALWAEIQRRWEAQDKPTREHLSDTLDLDPNALARIGGRDHFRYATKATEAGLRFVAAEAGALPAAEGGGERVVPVGARAGLGETRIPSFRLELQSVRAHLSSRRLRAFYSGTVTFSLEGVVESGEKLSLSDAKRLVPVLVVKRLAERTYPRRPDMLTRVSLSLNGSRRFDASPDLPVVGETAFVLVPAASP